MKRDDLLFEKMLRNAVFRLGPFNNYVPVRGKRVWSRKPLGAPVAKSKLFRVPQKPDVPQDEVQEIRRLYNNYKNHMKSLRQYFVERARNLDVGGEKAQALLHLEEEEHVRLMEENRLENEKTAALRELRLQAERERTREKVLQSLVKAEAQEELLRNKLLTYIQEKEATPFISRENIVSAIESALANPQNFNFSINQDGYVFRGKETSLENVPEEKRERLLSEASPV